MSARILIVEDQRDLAEVMKARLTSAGYQCGVTTDPTKAFDIIKKRRPDLVIMDVMMPKVSGFELCRKIRMDPVVFGTPVLMLSGMKEQPEIAHAFEQGANEYLTKPFDLGDLLQKIKELLTYGSQVDAKNPVSGLPGRDFLEQVVMNKVFRGDHVAVVHFNLAHSAAFGAAYGPERRDKAIAAVAAFIPDAAAGIDALEVYTAHLGGFDFLICCNTGDADPLAQALTGRFEHLKSSLYDKGDFGRGNLIVNGEEHLLMHVVIGMITNEHHTLGAKRLVKIAMELNRRGQHNGSTKILTAEDAIIV